MVAAVTLVEVGEGAVSGLAAVRRRSLEEDTEPVQDQATCHHGNKVISTRLQANLSTS